MKNCNKLSVAFSFFLAIAVSFPLASYSQSIFDYEGITYRVIKDADEASTFGTVAVTAKSDGFYEGTVTIPNAIKQSDDKYSDVYKVVAIDDVAFKGSPTLKKVVLPMTIESIGNGAFDGCVQLTEVEIPEGKLTQIGERAFATSGLKTIKLPEGITEIRPYTFYECRALEQIILPESLLKIGEAAFMFCQSLQSIEFPKKLREIGVCAFCYCGLKSLALPDRVTVIEASFGGCFDLEEVHLSEYTTTIKVAAFDDCNITKINKPETLTNIEEGAFGYCPNLPEYFITGDHAEFIKSEGYKNMAEKHISDMKKTMWK